MKKKIDLKIKVGSEDMVFWRDIVEARKEDISISEKNLKYYREILKMAEENYKKAEQEFNTQDTAGTSKGS